MNRSFKFLILVFAMASLITTGCRKATQSIDSKEALEAHRTELRAQVTSGKITEAEAIVALAEATRELKFSKKGTKKNKTIPRELRAFGENLKKQVTSGELNEEDAKAKWIEATKRKRDQKAPVVESKQTAK